HSIGEPTMGWIDEEFDHACIRHFEDGEDARLAAFLTEALARTGNGAHEIRDWVIAHAAAGSKGFELIDYFPSPQTLVGAGFASSRVRGSAYPARRRSRFYCDARKKVCRKGLRRPQSRHYLPTHGIAPKHSKARPRWSQPRHIPQNRRTMLRRPPTARPR